MEKPVLWLVRIEIIENQGPNLLILSKGCALLGEEKDRKQLTLTEAKNNGIREITSLLRLNSSNYVYC